MTSLHDSAAIHLQDCLPGMQEHLADGSVSVVVTSPPYNLGIQYGAYEDRRRQEEYLAWCFAWGAEVARVLEPEGSFFLNVGGSLKEPLRPFEVLQEMLRHGLQVQNVIHWIKSMSPDLPAQEPVEGHVKPITSARFMNDAHEYVFHLTKTGSVPLDRLAVGVRYADEGNLKRGTRGKNGNVRCAGNVWHLPYRTIQRRETDRPHPATFPPELAERCLRLHGLERVRLVLDPFMGIGSTARACRTVGVPCVGFEIDPEYWAVAKEAAG